MAEDGTERIDLTGWFVGEYPRLVRFAIVVCGDAHLAEDLVQEAYIRARLAGARTEDRIGAYVRRIIVNLGRSRFRRILAERRALDRTDPVTEAAPVGERDEAIWSALLQLAPRQRAAVALRFYEDLSDADIASVLGIGEGSVRQHLFRGMTRLRALLGEGGER